jgi:hypothetical protein
MTPAEAYKITRNPDDYSEAEIRKANKILEAYSDVTERDRTGGFESTDSETKKQATKKPQGKARGGMAKKAQMMRGGMANGKMHMYAAGGSVTENPGLKALKASGPKGMQAYNKITGK